MFAVEVDSVNRLYRVLYRTNSPWFRLWEDGAFGYSRTQCFVIGDTVEVWLYSGGMLIGCCKTIDL